VITSYRVLKQTEVSVPFPSAKVIATNLGRRNMTEFKFDIYIYTHTLKVYTKIKNYFICYNYRNKS